MRFVSGSVGFVIRGPGAKEQERGTLPPDLPVSRPAGRTGAAPRLRPLGSLGKQIQEFLSLKMGT